MDNEKDTFENRETERTEGSLFRIGGSGAEGEGGAGYESEADKDSGDVFSSERKTGGKIDACNGSSDDSESVVHSPKEEVSSESGTSNARMVSPNEGEGSGASGHDAEKSEGKTPVGKKEKNRSKDDAFSAGDSDEETPPRDERNNSASYFGSNDKDKKDDDSYGRGMMFSEGPLSGKKSRLGLAIFALLIFIFGLTIFTGGRGNSAQEVSYSTFLNVVENNNVKSADIKNSGRISFVASNGATYRTKIPYFDETLMQNLRNHGVDISGSEEGRTMLTLLIEFLPMLIFIVFMVMMMRNASAGQMMQFGRSHAKQFTDKDVKTKFKDVAGQREAKFELEEVVDFLKNPKKFSEIGAKIPKGVLLVGPPGTGKTLLAKAVAGEAGVSFFHTSGSDFVEMFVGMGAARVRSLFDQGRRSAPCILFIDEIDAVGRARGSGLGGGHDEREQTLNQILVEMDGFDTSSGVIVIAATNRSDVLDPALLRPGRFDRQVAITLPDIQEREDILKIHAEKVKLEPSVDLRRIARATSGASGADLANLVNEAALFATRAGRAKVEMQDFEQARDKMVLGVARKSHVMTDADKMLTAYHESGHALLFYYLPDLDPLYKVTIIPHGNAGGVTMGLPEDDASYIKKSTLISHITMAMGGYVAEEILNGQTSTGPSSDIKQATEIARRMVTEWGMSRLGFISLGSESEPLFLGREIAQHKDFSEETAKRIDEEIQSILSSCMKNARDLLKKHRDQLDLLANELIRRETMDDRDVRELLGFEQIGEKNTDIL